MTKKNSQKRDYFSNFILTCWLSQQQNIWTCTNLPKTFIRENLHSWIICGDYNAFLLIQLTKVTFFHWSVLWASLSQFDDVIVAVMSQHDSRPASRGQYHLSHQSFVAIFCHRVYFTASESHFVQLLKKTVMNLLQKLICKYIESGQFHEMCPISHVLFHEKLLFWY